MRYSREFINSLSDKYANIYYEPVNLLLNSYKRALETDSVTPIFSKTAKYESFPKKHVKTIRRGNSIVIKGSASGHRLFTPNSDIDRIKQAVRGTLNKINDRNFEIVMEELVREIVKFNSVETLDILSEEIHKKIMYDVKYQAVYVTLCIRIWSLTEWQDSLITIITGPEASTSSNSSLYWIKNLGVPQEDTVLYGPFADEDSLRINARATVSFRRILMDLLRSEFMKRGEYLNKYYEKQNDDGEQFKAKRLILCVVEFITKLYASGHMDVKVIRSVFADLLSGEKPDGIYIETFCTGWKSLGNTSANNGFKEIFVPIITQLLGDGKAWPNRIKFMMEDWLRSVGPFLSKTEDISCVPLQPTCIKDIVMVYFNNCEQAKVMENIKRCDKHELLKCIVDAVLDEPKRLSMTKNLIKNAMIEDSLIQKVIEEFMQNIDDICIDIPHAKNTLSALKNIYK